MTNIVKTMQQEAQELRKAINTGIADCDAGRTVPMGQAFEEAREELKRKHNE